MKKILALPAIALGLSGCATSTFSVVTEPLAADVFFRAPGEKEKKPLGKTPLTLPMSELRQTIGSAASGEYFPVIIEKPGFVTETYFVPLSGFGTMLTKVDVKLTASDRDQDEKVARQLIDRLFLAQRFAQTQQFERAQIELDRILADHPRFSRAMTMRGAIYFAQKNYPESLKWYEEALKVDPQLDDAVKMAARIREVSGGRAPAASQQAPVPAASGSPQGSSTP